MRITAPLLILAATTATAAPVDPTFVPEQATWVLHVDVTGIQQSKAMGAGDADWLEREINEKIFEEFGEQAHAEFHDLTLFGIETEEEYGGLRVRGTADVGWLVRTLEMATDDLTRSVAPDGSVVYAFDEGDEVGQIRIVVPQVQRQHDAEIAPWQLEVAPSDDALVQLLVPPTRRSPLLDNVPDGALVFIATDDLASIAGEDAGPASHLFSSTRSFTLVVLEEGDHIVASASAECADDRTASDLGAMLTGLLAMARLADPEDQEQRAMLDLLSNVLVSVDGNNINAEFRIAGDQFADILRSMDISGESNGDGNGSVDVRINVSTDDENDR